MGGAKIEADFGMIQRKHLTVTGSTLRGRSIADKAQIVSALKDKVWPLWAQGQAAHLHLQDLSAGRGVEGTRADGVEPAYRQDHPRAVS